MHTSSTRPQAIATFGQALHKLREDRGLSWRTLADMASVSIRDIRDWEDGVSYPTRAQFQRLMHLAFRQLKSFEHLLPARNRGQAISAEEETVESPLDADAAADAAAAESALPIFAHFGEALRHYRRQADFNQQQIADLLTGSNAPVGGSAVAGWEGGKSNPIELHYTKLCQLFPELMDAPKPDYRAISKPPGKTYSDDDVPVMRLVPPAPVVAPAPVVEPMPPSPPPPPPRPVVEAPVAPPPPRTVAPLVSAALTIEQASVAYGQALVAKGRLENDRDRYKALLEEIASKLKGADAEIRAAKNALDDAVVRSAGR